MNSTFSNRLRSVGCAIVFAVLGVAPPHAWAQSETPPTKSDVAYGDHPKQVMHFWQAQSDTPTPLVFFIHGGGWQGGNRMNRHLLNMLDELLDKGISAVSIEYRFIAEAIADGVEPPVRAPLHDAARALQFVRHHATQWNIDPQKIIACGGSAGACSSLWLAFHDDLAQPESDDPIARQSTRLLSAAVIGAQTTLDPAQMKAWTPNSKYGSHAFGIFKPGQKRTQDFPAFLKARDELKELIAEFSPYALVSADDPPVYLYYGADPKIGHPQKDPTHTSNFGVELKRQLMREGVDCELVYPSSAGKVHANVAEYITETLAPTPVEGNRKKRRPNLAMAPVTDIAGLPRVLLIGDSISIGYTVPTRTLLEGIANVHRPLTNCGPTSKGVEQLDQWLGKEKWDVIHFNFGLHDLKYMGPNGENLADPNAADSHQQIPPAEYENNLREIVTRLKKTGAKLVWRNTTPVPAGAKGRVVGHSDQYNEIAKKIMVEEEIPIDDQFRFVKNQTSPIQRRADVHFTPEGSRMLAEQVVQSIRPFLPSPAQ